MRDDQIKNEQFRSNPHYHMYTLTYAIYRAVP